MKNISKSLKVLTGVAMASVITLGAFGADSASANNGKIMWGKTELKAGQIGKVVISEDTSLFRKLDNGKLEVVRTLSKGEEYRVYNYKDGHYGVGAGMVVSKESKGIKYQTPSKAKLALINPIKVTPKPEVKPPVVAPPVVTPPVVAPPVVAPPVEKEEPVVTPPVVNPPVVNPPVVNPPVVTPPVTPPVVTPPTADLNKVKDVQDLIDQIPANYTLLDAIDFELFIQPVLGGLTAEEKALLDTTKYDELLDFLNNGGTAPTTPPTTPAPTTPAPTTPAPTTPTTPTP